MHPLIALALLSTAQAAPTWLAGDWEPYSNAFIGLRMLTVDKNTLSWKGCSNAGFEVVDSGDDTVTIRLAKGSTCALDDAPPTRMDTIRFTLRDNHCDLGITVYASPDAVKRNEPAAEGLYGRSKCPSGPAAQAAANLSTTTR
ncbi:MAG TPA: hypothetical protein VM621_06820 [Luteibacter sp.]|uniref:hypothetical protein n=1 Tax=Luteibacter sp. TaxID=1886636 RepID=UPI002B5B1567|nr:hypothetical protein [Luteibacter sp.]HVI54749.1 hypothetical protein [Luteibacter sp.]